MSNRKKIRARYVGQLPTKQVWPTTGTCKRCGTPVDDRADWNIQFSAGVATGHICPDCQTPEENAEAEINLATVDYSDQVVIDGRLVAGSKFSGGAA